VTDTSASATTGRSAASSIGYVTSRDGTRIAFERTGSGSPLVLVHGTSADRTRWTPVLPALESKFSVYAMDRRGRGLSEDAEAFALEREFEDVAAVVGSIDGPVDLLGHSYGALCAMEAALLCPNVRRLVLYEPPMQTDEPMYPVGMRDQLEAMIERGEREQALITFFREVVEMSDSDLEMMRAAPSWGARVAAAHTVPREFDDADYALNAERFEGLLVPVLLLAGSESPPMLRAATEMAHAALPKSRVAVMEGQAHVAVNTAPDLFTRLVIEFLTT
jgi:pimeloyl-ACP methyl ester carboxylesterase